MLDLDFAYLSLQTSDRKGLAGRKYFLDRLAPLFYGPRIARLIKVPSPPSFLPFLFSDLTPTPNTKFIIWTISDIPLS